MATTYDLSGAVGQIRFLARDTNVQNASFTDEEWTFVTTQVPEQNSMLTAAMGLRIIANDLARLSKWAEAGVATDAAADEAIRLAEWYERKVNAELGLNLPLIQDDSVMELNHLYHQENDDLEETERHTLS